MNSKKKPAEQRAAFNERAGTESLGRAVSLHLEGKLKEALRELDEAIERGESSAEIHSARGHIQFELEQFEDAAGHSPSCWSWTLAIRRPPLIWRFVWRSWDAGPRPASASSGLFKATRTGSTRW